MFTHFDCVCSCLVCVSSGLCMPGQACSNRRTNGVSALLLPCGSWNWTQVLCLGTKCLFLLGHLAGLSSFFFSSSSSSFTFPFSPWDTVSCSPGWPCYVAVDDLECLLRLPLSLQSWDLGQFSLCPLLYSIMVHYKRVGKVPGLCGPCLWVKSLILILKSVNSEVFFLRLNFTGIKP